MDVYAKSKLAEGNCFFHDRRGNVIAETSKISRYAGATGKHSRGRCTSEFENLIILQKYRSIVARQFLNFLHG